MVKQAKTKEQKDEKLKMKRKILPTYNIAGPPSQARITPKGIYPLQGERRIEQIK